MNTLARRACLLLTLAGLAAATLFCLRQASARRATWPPEADTFYLPSSRTLHLLSLGHHELAADLVAARGNVYFGTQIMQKGPQRWLAQYVNTAIDLDPHFHRLYTSGAAMVMYSGRTIDVETVQASAGLLERGMAVFPLDWEIKFQVGFNYFFELPKLVGADDPRVPGWRQRGVEALRQAALFEGVPDWLPNLVARMLTKNGSEDLAIRHLEQAYAVSSSEEARAQIRFKLTQLKGQQFLRQLEEEKARFDRMIKDRYPYAPEAFSVIAPRRERAVDLDGDSEGSASAPAIPGQ